MLRPMFIVVALVFSLAACNKFPGKGDKKDTPAAPVKLVIAPEDILTMQASAELA